MPIQPVLIEMNPARFYTLVDMVKSAEPKSKELNKFIEDLEKVVLELDTHVQVLGKANNSFLKEVRMTTRHKGGSGLFDDEDDMAFQHVAGGQNFLRVAFEATRCVQQGFHGLLSAAQGLHPETLILSKKKFGVEVESFEQLQHMKYEFELNKPTMDKFLTGLLMLDDGERQAVKVAESVVRVLDYYYQALLTRHSVEGIEVHRDPIATDLAMSIYENVDSHGEIADGKKPDEISAYSKRKAEVIAGTLKTGFVNEYIRDPSSFHEFLKSHLKALWDSVGALSQIFKEEIEKATSMHDVTRVRRQYRIDSKHDFEYIMMSIDDLDPREIVYKERAVLLTAEERFNLKFRNDTLKRVTDMLAYGTSEELIQYILERKAELRAYFQDENSFYVCKMGAGNPFSGQAPGALEVVPGQRPIANLDEIIGSGFQDVKQFFQTIEDSATWNDLFLATSPSRTTDKSNVLLVGPQGCGKTEILRAVGGDKKSIGIFAQGSDFLTCWAGEAQKNPKRLFEGGLKLQKESRKHVHFLIDEIDAVLNSDRSLGSNSMNLTLEFQILMDGVVHYPNLSIWGATNNPERIPMPMIRRFSKVVIVGELSQADRIRLLQQFMSFLPLSDIGNRDWNEAAEKLEGATGDVIRKVADHVWRSKMSGFVNSHHKEAKELIDWLNPGEKFQIASFDEKRRNKFKERLGAFTRVSAKDVHDSVDVHLRNFAVRSEIDTARATYKKAHEFLDALASDKIA